MKRLVEEIEGEGLEKLIGDNVLLMCANYFYAGKLVGVNDTCVLISEPAIVYETGEWSSKAFKDVQKLHVPEWYVVRSMIESFGKAK